LFTRQEEYFDIPIQDQSPRQVRDRLAQLASEVLSLEALEKFKDLLVLKGTPNGGNAVTDDLKYTSMPCFLLHSERHILTVPISQIL
jgi:hypothetical protein